MHSTHLTGITSVRTAFACSPDVQAQLRQRAAAKQTSLRHVMLAAFQAIGLSVEPAHLSADERPARDASRGSQVAFAVPLSVMTQLRALAASRQCSLRCLMLNAVCAIGIRVEPSDLVRDGRQRRPRGSRRHYAGEPRVKGGSLSFPNTSQSSRKAVSR